MAAKSAIPSSVIIVGSGVFGLSTAYALAQRPAYKDTRITLLERLPFPAPDGSSVDASRIVRADYPDPAYAALMNEGLQHWRGDLGAEGRYNQTGLAIFSESPDDEHAHYYLTEAFRNVTEVLGLKQGRKEDGGEVELVDDAATVKRIMGTAGGNVGMRGYVNWTSGWANAGEGVKYVRRKCEATGRVEFRTAEVKRLLFQDGSKVAGVELGTGEELTADLTVLATGAWTPKLIDLRGVASATGQVMAYIDITPEEQARLATNPTYISESNGMFIIPPIDGKLKVARHGFGYANPVTIAHPEVPGETITVSLPRTKHDDPHMAIPPEGQAACREFLRRCVPALGERPFTQTRVCWYTDTPHGDWLISHHPRYAGLFVATGGSGHGYKFLPVIGERIADVISREDRDDLGRDLRIKWAWPTEKFETDHVWTKDWRGGQKGMVLDEEYAKAS